MPRGLLFAIVSLAFTVPSVSFAQTRERVKITGVRLGFPGSGGAAFKAGQWAPVYVDLECTKDTTKDESKLLLIVETKDADEAITEGTVEIPAMAQGDRLNGNELGRIPYLKLGSAYASVTVRVKGAQTGRTYGESSDRGFTGTDTAVFVILGIGTNLNGIRFPVAGVEQGDSPSSRNGWVRTANVLDVGLLPDHWFGFGAVDLMVLGTGSDRAFWETLAAPQHEKRRKAIVEWVRRGGRAVLSVGNNPDVLDSIKEFKDLLPATIPPGSKKMVTGMPFEWKPSGANERNDAIRVADGKSEFPIVTLQPKADRATSTIVDDGSGRPVAVQGAYGLGRITVFAFDLDRLPFTDWNKRAPFWENVVNYCGYMLPPSGQKPEKYSSIQYDDLTTRLQGSLDFFEGVPVVSFGWVALFILIYIILIGPVDYLFLKKVIRKLEWTWVTFPVIVIGVSAAAYFAAYALKGKDLKTNKVDVVDIDLAGKRIDGNAWFTLFSPRIQNYTIAVEPAGPVDGGPAWAANSNAGDTVISWQGNVERNRYGGGGGGFFAKKYKYESGTDPTDPNKDLYAAGLEGVPIQVWTTKTFHVQWSAPIDPAKPPIVADLAVNKTAENILIGSITNNLPVEAFTDVAIFWRGRVFNLPKEFPIGIPRPISFSAEVGAGDAEQVKDWLKSGKRYPDGGSPWSPPVVSRSFQSSDNGSTSNPNFRLWPILFADIVTDDHRQYAPNASMRRIDQSWRVGSDRPEQAMLVMRLPTREDDAETMTQSPLSPSRLWLGALPSAGGKRPDIQGRLKQETYIRVFIPVKTAKK